MSILVSSRNGHLLCSLRHLFDKWGNYPFLEARSLAEFRHHIQEQGTRIRLIIQDADQDEADPTSWTSVIREYPELELTPRGLIRGSFGGRKTADPPGYHFHLTRPFNEYRLIRSLLRGVRKDAEHRRRLLYLCSPQRIPEHLIAASRGIWSEVTLAHSVEEIEKKLPLLAPVLGAIVIDPTDLPTPVLGWLKRFRKTHQGAQTLLVCADKRHEAVQPVRQLCQLFVPHVDSRAAWRASLQLVFRHMRSDFGVQFMTVAIRHARKNGRMERARFLLRLLLTFAPFRCDVQHLAGTMFKQPSPQIAYRHFKRAMELNPCMPGAYVQALSLPAREIQREAISRAALAYCPRSPEVLQAARRLTEHGGVA